MERKSRNIYRQGPKCQGNRQPVPSHSKNFINLSYLLFLTFISHSCQEFLLFLCMVCCSFPSSFPLSSSCVPVCFRGSFLSVKDTQPMLFLIRTLNLGYASQFVPEVHFATSSVQIYLVVVVG